MLWGRETSVSALVSKIRSGSCELLVGGWGGTLQGAGRPCTFQALLKHYGWEECQSDVYSQERYSFPGLGNSLDAKLSCVSKPWRTAGRAINPKEGREKAQGIDCGWINLFQQRWMGLPPASLWDFQPGVLSPPVPKVAIHALNGHYCLISSLSAINSNPRLGLPSQDQSHKDVCPRTGLWRARGHMYVFVLGPSWDHGTSLWPRRGFPWGALLLTMTSCYTMEFWSKTLEVETKGWWD